MPAVSDSSPLIVYAKIGRLSILRGVFGEVLVPGAVYQEVVGAATRAGAVEVRQAAWIRRLDLRWLDVLEQLAPRLGRGEAESIALAAELGGDAPVLLDDRAGRSEARRRGLRVLGSAGVLVLAKRARLISAARPDLDRLRLAGLFLSDSAYRAVLAQAGEG